MEMEKHLNIGNRNILAKKIVLLLLFFLEHECIRRKKSEMKKNEFKKFQVKLEN